MTRLIHGKGVFDGGYQVSGKIYGDKGRCPFYSTWAEMIRRGCTDYFKTYSNVSVCKEWLIFSNFRDWMVQQQWIGNDLDKDIVNPGAVEYSPENCCFVSHGLNTLLNNCSAARGLYPTGVFFDKSRGLYAAKMRVFGKTTHLGRHKTARLAQNAYNLAKADHILEISSLVDDPRISSGLDKHAKLLQQDIVLTD